MAQDPQSLRRRAALAALRPLLDDAALIDALWELQETMRGDGVSDVIGYADSVAKRHLLDPRTTKRLYEELYRALRNPGDNLPDDPLPAMQAARAVQSASALPAVGYGRAAPPPPAPPARPQPQPAPPVPTAPVQPAAAPAVAAPALANSAIANAPPEQAVFSGLIRSLLDEMQQFHQGSIDDLRSDALKDLARARLSTVVKQQYKDAWEQPLQHSWLIQGNAQELSALTHMVYVGLCETLGPVDADQVLGRAVRSTERLPQARQFPPKRLL
ncbi:MAG: hypothetical protein RJA44_1868 [Pseudomonadota bacterium]